MDERTGPTPEQRLAEIIRRVRQLRPDQLLWLQRVLDILECGDSSPLSAFRMAPDSSTSESRRLAAKVSGRDEKRQ
jgi:hypothetical protein